MASLVRKPRASCSAAARARLAPLAAAAAAAVLLLAGGRPAVAGQNTVAKVAVFPAENLSGGGAPVDEVRQFLIGTLSAGGVAVLRDDVLDAFMARHRIRYAAGIDAPTAEALRKETGVDAVVFASLELSSDAVPPKVAVIVRLVSIAAAPAVVWADDAGMAGDDAPGFFELGVVNDYKALLAKALDRLGTSLMRYLKGGAAPGYKAAAKFHPRSFHRSLALEPGRSYSVAVVPFVNVTDRRNAGDILSLLFIRHLAAFPPFRVIDTGAARRGMLDARIIMNGGLSLSDADTVAALAEADFVLAGRVLRYEDYEGAVGKARVEFSAILIEKKSRKVVWSSHSYNESTDGVHFFERGTSRTAHVMATQMVRLTAEMIAGGRR